MGKILKFTKRRSELDQRTVADVLNTMTEEQLEVVYFLVGTAIKRTGAKEN